MYGDFLSVLEAKSRKRFEKLYFDYYSDFLYISFYLRSDSTLYIVPYTIKYKRIEVFRGNYRLLAENLIENLYRQYINYEYPRKNTNKSHFV